MIKKGSVMFDCKPMVVILGVWWAMAFSQDGKEKYIEVITLYKTQVEELKTTVTTLEESSKISEEKIKEQEVKTEKLENIITTKDLTIEQLQKINALQKDEISILENIIGRKNIAIKELAEPSKKTIAVKLVESITPVAAIIATIVAFKKAD